MAIQYPVAPGSIVRCDYKRGGFKPPEMVKVTPKLSADDFARIQEAVLCALGLGKLWP